MPGGEATPATPHHRQYSKHSQPEAVHIGIAHRNRVRPGPTGCQLPAARAYTTTIDCLKRLDPHVPPRPLRLADRHQGRRKQPAASSTHGPPDVHPSPHTQMLALPSPSRVVPDRGGGIESLDASSRSCLRMSAPDTRVCAAKSVTNGPRGNKGESRPDPQLYSVKRCRAHPQVTQHHAQTCQLSRWRPKTPARRMCAAAPPNHNTGSTPPRKVRRG